jgi:hypothetical protein
MIAWSGRSWDNRLRGTAESLGLLAAHLNEAAERFLIESTNTSAFETAHAIELPLAAQAMARHRPALLLRLSAGYYLRCDLERDEASASRASVNGVPPRRGWGGDESGVREHLPHRGGPLAHPDYGPFAALLAADPPGGLRLVAAVVDAATDARIRAESRGHDRELRLNLALAHWPTSRTYRGTTNVWTWYRGRGIGDYPAFSALMALRAWGAERIAHDDPPQQVIDDILDAGGSLGLVAVAFSLLVGVLEQHGELLHPFLAHPLVWQLETLRTRPGSLPTLHVPEAPRIDQDIESVALDLTLASDEAQRLALQHVGRVLISYGSELEGPCGLPQLSLEQPDAGITYPQPDTTVNEMITRKWAAILDGATYTTNHEPDGRIAIRPSINPEVAEGLAAAGGRHAAAYIEITAVTAQAIEYGNCSTDGTTAAEMHRTMTTALGQLTSVTATEETRLVRDCAAAVAAALLIAPARGEQIADEDLTWAARTLLDAADPEPQLPRAFGDTPEQLWEMGADRSAAVGLPWLLLHPHIQQRTGVEADTLTEALVTLAGSMFIEVRQRLARALAPTWSVPCEKDCPNHDTALAALRGMLATSGLGPRHPGARIRQPVRLLEPLPDAIVDDAIRLEFGLVSPAITGLAAAARSECPHGRQARDLLEALTTYDTVRWPIEYARERFEQRFAWRNAIDQYSAQRILDGDQGHLSRYLRAFAPVAEQLSGLLTAMVGLATTTERVSALEGVWPSVMNALLPEDRQIVTIDGRRPQEEDIEALDAALLPLPPEDAPWPTERTGVLIWRWVRSYESCPHLADRLIDTINRGGWLEEPEATRATLLVLGTDPVRIKAESRLVVAWLRYVFTHPSAIGDHRPTLQRMLDELVTVGHRRALILQSELEA